jgi:class 3 adenylate cyclase
MGEDVGGIAVHIGARVAESAATGEVLVSSTVKDLVTGSGLEFEDRGAQELRGRARKVAPLRGERLSIQRSPPAGSACDTIRG